jgi:two-component system response regulator AtoC
MGSQKRRSSRVATHDKPITSDKTTVEDGQPPRVGHREESALVLYARDVVRVVPLRPGSPLSIGRSAPSDVVLDDPLLSRQHVQVTLKDGALLVEDLASTNGTYVRGARVTSELVAAGESFQLGSVTASLSVAGSEGLLRGLSSHARLLSRLDDEVLRARAFGRPLAVALIRAAARSETGATHVSRWASRLRAALRPVDGLAIYAPSSMLVILPELDAVRAVEEAQRFTLRTDPSEPTLLAGLAVFPDAASAEELVDLARRAVRAATPSAPVQLLGARTESTDGGRTAIAASPSMREILALTRRLGPSNVPVLILGETGSGKEIIARRLHDESPRREAPLRAINCGAIPSALLPSVLFGHERGAFTGADVRTLGLFEQAHGGTVFLDEVGELSAAAQAALLRVLETKRLTRVGGSEELEVDVRILAATHRDLPEQVARGVFRQDLFYRLNTVTVSVPPLRENCVGSLRNALRSHGRSARFATGIPQRALRQASPRRRCPSPPSTPRAGPSSRGSPRTSRIGPTRSPSSRASDPATSPWAPWCSTRRGTATTRLFCPTRRAIPTSVGWSTCSTRWTSG